ncbi:MAG TPA: sigma 54-interacting transcriptional regulator, partial [Polyangiaceae bacterium]
RNAAMRELYTRIRRVARTDVAVLLLGETGVGKEVVAHAIHHASPRRSQAWVTVNCAAIPENLMESEFFGYERGAFSGAVTSKPGLFEAADRGTLFLDEVGELPKSLQAKLLRVLETGEVQRIGAVKGTRVDVRIVAATNGDIVGGSASGTFRSDLYYRLNGMTLSIPPLRDRVDDVPILTAHFARRMGGGSPPTFSDAAVAALQAHPWRGNVRELRAVVERALIMAEGERVVGTRHLMFDASVSTVSAPPEPPPHHRASRGKAGALHEVPSIVAESKGQAPAAANSFASLEANTGRVADELKAELERREQKKIRAALARAAGNQTDAAKILGVSRRTLINRMERYRIERPRKKSGDPG